MAGKSSAAVSPSKSKGACCSGASHGHLLADVPGCLVGCHATDWWHMLRSEGAQSPELQTCLAPGPLALGFGDTGALHALRHMRTAIALRPCRL